MKQVYNQREQYQTRTKLLSGSLDTSEKKYETRAEPIEDGRGYLVWTNVTDNDTADEELDSHQTSDR